MNLYLKKIIIVFQKLCFKATEIKLLKSFNFGENDFKGFVVLIRFKEFNAKTSN